MRSLEIRMSCLKKSNCGINKDLIDNAEIKAYWRIVP